LTIKPANSKGRRLAVKDITYLSCQHN
jgi:hypothetical protein